MEKQIIQMQMLGGFSLTRGAAQVGAGDNRSYKVWLLLAYILYHRSRFIPREELIRLLGDEARNANPGGALKTVLWRARRSLEPLGLEEAIVSRNGAYGWNPDIPVESDVDAFVALCREGADQEEDAIRLDRFRRAAALYQGEFLDKFTGELWVEPIAVYLHNMYVSAVTEVMPLLDAADMSQEAVKLGRTALQFAPYQESLYRRLMRSLMAMEEYEAAAAVYEDLRKLLLDELTVIPDEETQAVYQEVIRHVGSACLTTEMILDELRVHEFTAGAMICDYTTFKIFYQAEARSAARRGDAIHIGILSVMGKEGQSLSPRKLEYAMRQLGEDIRQNLRTGDLACQCSASQFLLMLIQANFENSEMVCRRVSQAFARAHPRSPAKVTSVVAPLEPTL